MKKERKVQKHFVDEGFGFRVILENVPMIKIRDEWTLDVDYNRLSDAVLLALAHKPAKLTGVEVRFIRNAFEMTLEAFAKRFDVSHPAVKKWEDKGQELTAMSWSTEKDIRLEILQRFQDQSKKFIKVYRQLANPPKEAPKPIRLDFKKKAA